MTGTQVLKITFGFLLPVASGVVALVGQRKRVAVGTWKGNAFIYGPVIGASIALAVFVILVAASVASGH